MSRDKVVAYFIGGPWDLSKRMMDDAIPVVLFEELEQLHIPRAGDPLALTTTHAVKQHRYVRFRDLPRGVGEMQIHPYPIWFYVYDGKREPVIGNGDKICIEVKVRV